MTSTSDNGNGGKRRDEAAGRRATMELVSGTGRQRRGKIEAQRDREWLTWISRFRFVTAELLGARFGVSARQARARVRRLADADLVGLHRGHAGEPYAVVLTAKGAAALGARRVASVSRAPSTNACTSSPSCSWCSSLSWPPHLAPRC